MHRPGGRSTWEFPTSWYRHKVARDLQRWQQNGWLSDSGAASIRADLDARTSLFGAASILAILGAVLFGFAVMSFVAANWTALPKLARLLLLVGTLWACYGAAVALFRRQLAGFAEAATLGGIAVYGASIMLIAQMYHMEGNPPDAVLLWALGALLAAALVRSAPALAATFVLIVVWTCWERGLTYAPHWIFLAIWAVAAGVALWIAWQPGLHLAAISLVVWLVPLGYLLLDNHAHWLVASIGTGVAIAAVVHQARGETGASWSANFFTYGVLVAYAGLFVMQFVDDVALYGLPAKGHLARLVPLAVVAVVLLLAAIVWALHTGNRAALWLAYGGFALESLMLYVRTFDTLLNTSLFFLVAAIIVSGFAWAAYRLHLRKSLPGAAA